MELRAVDLDSDGFGMPWQHVRRYSNQLSANADVGQGYNWLVLDWPYLIQKSDGSITIVRSTNRSLWFTSSGGGYVGQFGAKSKLTHDAGRKRFVLTAPNGTRQEFHDFDQTEFPPGLFARTAAPGGQVTFVHKYTADGRIGEIRRSGTSGGVPVIESFVFTYNDLRRLTTILHRRKWSGSGWESIRRVRYDYYGSAAAYGSQGDLKRVRIQVPTDSGWANSQIMAYRYYVQAEANGFIHGLKYVIQPGTYQRMLDDSIDPLTATNTVVATYADNYFEYDNEQRVTLERINGGSRTFGFSYTPGPGGDFNSWAMKTVEALPNGNENIVYTNSLGQPLIKELRSGTERWIDVYQYDGDARQTLHAKPSAVIGYDDAQANLAIQLRPAGGFIELTEYYSSDGSGAAKGYVAARKIKRGANGTPVVLERIKYASRSAGGTTIHPVNQQTVYRNENETGAIETRYAYSLYPGSVRIRQRTTTLPAVAVEQNGTGVPATRKEFFDRDGLLIWSMDERGFITRNVYDLATSALVQRIDDVDTSTATGVPDGWTTPAGGGLNLVTDFESDARGRITQTLGPVHTIDLNGTPTAIRRANWTVYDDDHHVTYSGNGYATGTAPAYAYTLINPVSITQADDSGKVLAEIQATSSDTSGTLASIISDTGGGAAAFPQSRYTRWTTNQFTDCCLMTSQRVYHTIPASGDGVPGTNYDETQYGYDLLKRRTRTVTPGGTISDLVLDSRGLTVGIYVGTNDDGATEDDPTGGGSDPDNNMVIVIANEYDGGADGKDGNLTKQTQYASAMNLRLTTYGYGWRNRLVSIDGEIDFYEKRFYDNLNHLIRVQRHDTSTSGNLISRSETKYDNREWVYQTIRYAVDPSTGAIGNALTDNTWFDASGNVQRRSPLGSLLAITLEYDSCDRQIHRYIGFTPSSEATLAAITNDVVLEQLDTSYDSASNVIASVLRERYHDADDTQLGALGDPSTTPKARVTYQAFYPDALGRQVATANYGTNGGTAPTRMATIPLRSGTVLVDSASFNDAGRTEFATDPAGMVTKWSYDAAARPIAEITNFQEGSSSSSSEDSNDDGCVPSDDINVIVLTTYNADGNVSSLTAVNAATGNQVTQYIYGTTLVNSRIASSLLKRKEIYPDSTGDSDTIRFEYNRQQQVIRVTDQGGTVHRYDYDKLGRRAQDRVASLGSGVDGAIRRIATTFDVLGMRSTITSLDHPTVGSGTVVNECQYAYNDFGQLITEWQEHGGAVNTSTTPKVQYGYADGSDNTIRQTTLTYPNGRVLTYDYGSSGGINDCASRVASIIDDDDTHLVDYKYLGQSTFVEQDDTEPQVKWTLIDLDGEDDPDTGDIYSGLDRFGRVKDNRWYNYDDEEDIDRIQYGYDRASSRIWRRNVVARALSKEFDELYQYDGIHRLKTMDRGTLSTPPSSLSSTTFGQCWTLDATGNWQGFRQSNDGSTWVLEQARTANTVNEVTDITNSVGTAWVDPAYSPAGNMTTIPQPNDPTQSYAGIYDAWNRLVKLLAGIDTVSEYAYDGAKRRILQNSYTSGALTVTSDLYYTEPSKWQVVEKRLDSASDPDQQFVWGLRYIDNVILRDRTVTDPLDQRLYSQQDAHCSVTAIAAPDGTVQERYAYSAYGAPLILSPQFGSRTTSSFVWEILFCGYLQDPVTSLVSARNRDYHTGLGAWLRRDPERTNLGIINLYTYASADPINYIDPFGLQAAKPIKKCKLSCIKDNPEHSVGEPDGCSDVPDAPAGFDFLVCCNDHDYCYGECKEQQFRSGKTGCDSAFLRCMSDHCFATYGDGVEGIACQAAATLYYRGVRIGGNSAYNEAQTEACICTC